MAIANNMEPELTLSKPTPADFHALSVLQAAAFPEQKQENNLLRYQRYHKECPVKLEHCRIVKLRTPSSSEDNSDEVVAACQLQLRPRREDGVVDVFIEWIGCHPDHRGKGVGTMLLDWAGRFAKETLGATTLGLYMVLSNTGARRLYERNGFAPVQSNKNSKKAPTTNSEKKTRLQRFQRNFDRLFGHWSILRMEKKLY